jgi:2-dehydro-3-deoxygluconokinase
MLVTLGEALAVLNATEPGPLRHAREFRLTIAGAEANVAIGAVRLGTPAAYVGRVGDDEFGRLVHATLRGEGVDVSGLTVDGGAPTGLMVKEHRLPGVVRVNYYRTGSAGSRLTAGDLPTGLIHGAAVLHVSGITPALSAGAREAVFTAVELAGSSRAAGASSGGGVRVAMDVNYRSRLWAADEARPVLADLAARADILFAGEDEAELLTGSRDPAALAGLGPSEVVVKRGERGCTALCDGRLLTRAARTVRAVDAVGAGDAFAAGYLADRIAGRDPRTALRTAVATGAFAVTQHGDWEGLPRRAELALLDQADGAVLR